jgi:hypothetical protein
MVLIFSIPENSGMSEVLAIHSLFSFSSRCFAVMPTVPKPVP